MQENNLLLKELNQLKQDFEAKEKWYEEQFWVDSHINELDDLMRVHYHKTVEEFAKIVLDYLSDVCNALNGVVYITQPNTQLLEAKAVYACVLDNLQKKAYQMGEDMVGQVAISKKMLTYEDIQPQNVELKFSIMEVNTFNLVFQPLVFNEITYGVLELIFIQALTDYQKEFLQKSSRNIAILIESISNTQITKQLLKDSQEITERLLTQEEELRQNNEELITTQEELERRSIELNAQLTAVNHSAIAKVELTPDGIIEFVNESFCKIFGYSEDELLNKHHRVLVPVEYANSSDYELFLENLKNGVSFSGEILRKAKNGAEVWLNATYSPVFLVEGSVRKVIKLAFDITQSKIQNLEVQNLLSKLQAKEAELFQNLEELKTTQDVLEKQNQALSQKEKELKQLVAEMRVNEEDMQKTEKKFRETIKNFQLQSKELEAQKMLVQQLQDEIQLLKMNKTNFNLT